MGGDSQEQQIRSARLQKVNELRKLGIEPYPYLFNKTHSSNQVHEQFDYLENSQESDKQVSVAGRILSIRNDGMFIDLHDPKGKVQIFSHKKSLMEDKLALVRYFDLGDIIGVVGKVRRTSRGEITVDAADVQLLSKCLLPLPEKYHGLTDRELRYRQRYLDLIINPESRDVFIKRCAAIDTIRKTLVDDDFIEVETPVLHPIAGGAIAKPFVTRHNALNMDLFLRIAPELYLKRLIVGGLSERVFEISRCFRNEGISTRHNPEFTTIEIYQAYADYNVTIEITEKIVASVAQALHKSLQVEYDGKILDFSAPWKRQSMTELIKECTGIDFLKIIDAADAKTHAKAIDVKVDDNFGWGKVVEAVFEEKVEHLLIQPTHVTDLPREISPLSKVHRHDPRLTERFETYINGWEIANGFSELNDPVDQYSRFADQLKAHEAGDDEAHRMDEDFITSLEYAMPPCAGLGIGIDRLVMLMTNSSSIRNVITFPTLRDK
ncbi:MAG: lysine--tRNA ligase [Holosporales bacterium]|jgi:lysyl-tRNA synthetase class 2|nr:lysine--tRNA ligase [Holosporales bacterium]